MTDEERLNKDKTKRLFGHIAVLGKYHCESCNMDFEMVGNKNIHIAKWFAPICPICKNETKPIEHRTMTDEEIIKLAEKTKEEKYCPKYKVCLLGIDECHISCPNSYVDDILGVVCSDTSYEAGFLDGFKSAMEHISKSNKTII